MNSSERPAKPACHPSRQVARDGLCASCLLIVKRGQVPAVFATGMTPCACGTSTVGTYRDGGKHRADVCGWGRSAHDDPLRVVCPSCRATPGNPCQVLQTPRYALERRPHQSRRQAAGRAVPFTDTPGDL